MSEHRSCGSYGPGHRLHWIQTKKSHQPGQPVIKVKVVAVHDDGSVEIDGHEQGRLLWYHDADHLRSALRFGGYAEWKPRFRVLYMVSVGSFNLARPDQVQPCALPTRRRPTEATRQYIERAMRENHGCTVPQRWLADPDATPDGDTGEPQSGYLVGTNNPTSEEQSLLRNIADGLGAGSAADPRDNDNQQGDQH